MNSSDSLIHRILEATAWRMDVPEMYGAFHLCVSAALICLAVVGALLAKRLSDAGRVRLLSVCGWVLAVMEVYKQLFLYLIVNDGAYDWWFFPFQLCSVPMYLCILMPALASSAKDNASEVTVRHASRQEGYLHSSAMIFLAGYTFIGAAATFIVPEDILRPYMSLTLHGFLWHGILLFISLTVALSGRADLSPRGFAGSTALFIVMCFIALGINIAVEPAMASAFRAGLIPHNYAAMFYLNPYHISPQPLVDVIQKSAGIPLGLTLYVLVIILAAGAVMYIFRRSLGRR